jgi:lysophospholipase L1-like esterase
MRRSASIRRFCALLLAFLAAAACAVPALAAEPGFVNFQPRENSYADGTFSDVQEDWYTEYVAAVYELGLMQGGEDGRFRPDDGVTLAEACALAARIHRTYYGGTEKFEQGSPWYQVYVDYCREQGILTEDFADFNAAAKRSEFGTILARVLPEGALQPINDIADGAIPDLEYSADTAGIYRLYRAGVLTGSDVYGSFKPASTIRRSEVAAIISRMAYRSLRRTVSFLPKPPYPDLKEGERQPDSFFADAAMLGNSLVDGMKLSSGINMKYFGKTSGTVKSNRLLELLQYNFGKVYIQLGINEIGGSAENFINGYRSIIQQIRDAMPEADIYIMAITPVTKSKAASGSFSMTKINATNELLYALAEEMQCWYLDCCTPLCTSEGYLQDAYAGWDGSPHLDAKGYQAWAEVLRTHYAPEKEE